MTNFVITRPKSNGFTDRKEGFERMLGAFRSKTGEHGILREAKNRRAFHTKKEKTKEKAKYNAQMAKFKKNGHRKAF